MVIEAGYDIAFECRLADGLDLLLGEVSSEIVNEVGDVSSAWPRASCAYTDFSLVQNSADLGFAKSAASLQSVEERQHDGCIGDG
jgi:hypothetical protein